MAEQQTKQIISDLLNNFLQDKKDIQNKIIESETEIRQCNEYIHSLNRRDDCDYNLFSPRSKGSVNKDMVENKKKEIAELESGLRELYKRLSNITKKIDSIEKLNIDELDSASSTKESGNDSGSKLLALQEDDRHRIAADLHDTVLQNMTLILHNLELTSKFIDYDPIRAKLEIETNRKLVKETMEDIRSTIFDLRPMQFDDFGFKKTIEDSISNLRARTSMEISTQIDELDNVDNIFLLAIFRMTLELTTNAIKHSGGTKINVVIKQRNDVVTLEVSDNGNGMSNEAEDGSKHFGLKLIRERVSIVGGAITIESNKSGTTVYISVPV